jgi:hypothetical protein
LVVVVVELVELWTSLVLNRQTHYILFRKKMQAQYVASRKEIEEKYVCGLKVERFKKHQQII